MPLIPPLGGTSEDQAPSGVIEGQIVGGSSPTIKIVGSTLVGWGISADGRADPDEALTWFTDSSGKYRLAVRPGRYTMWFTSLGYADSVVRQNITVRSGEHVEVNATMRLWDRCSDCSAPIEPRRDVMVRLQTSLGAIEIAVDPSVAPITAADFLKYVDGGVYSNARFSHVTTTNGVQAAIDVERSAERLAPIPLERTSVTGLKHVAGTVSMVRGLMPDTATSDFFILLNDDPSFDVGGTSFGDWQGAAAFDHVVSGMDVVRKIQQQSTNGQSLTPPVTILSAARVEK